MKPIFLSILLAATCSAALAGVPTMTLPDLSFPPPAPDTVTSGCSQPATGQILCD